MRLQLIEELGHDLTSPDNDNKLCAVLSSVTRRLGFDHFALSYDQWHGAAPEAGLLLHNYPDHWAKVYVLYDLGRSDPIRRAGEHSLTGFAWRDLERLIALTRGDHRMLSIGTDHGVADGYTVPRHLPGFATGSCTFVIGEGKHLPGEMLPVAEILGALALSTAKRIAGTSVTKTAALLSDRQRECVLWSARGKSAGEIAAILGIAETTVIHHLKIARERYGVHRSEQLILCALFDGLIAFADIFRWWYFR